MRGVDGKNQGPAGELRQAAAFEELFEGDEVNTEQSLVVDTFVELVDTAPGTRPFRSLVGFDFGVVGPMNEAADPFYDFNVPDNFGDF